MANTYDCDFFRRHLEDDPVLPDSKSQVPLPPPSERFDITLAGFAVFS
jgi:hypothetical protein